MACPEVAGIDPQLVLYDRRHADVFETWLERLGDRDAAEDAAQWVLLGGSNGDPVEAAVPDLPIAARTALLLRERDGLSYAEVAQRLGVAEPTAKRIVYVARLRLVEALRRLGHALNLAPLLGWLKTAAAAKGIAAVATLGAAAGVSALAVPDLAPQPAAPQPARSVVTPPAEPTTRPAVRVQMSAPRDAPAKKSPSNTVLLDADAAPTRDADAAPTPEVPASNNLLLETTVPSPGPVAPPAEPIAVPEPVQEPVDEPVVPIPEVPLEPVAVEPPLPLDVPVSGPELELPPLPLP